jgi:hypothetical protein
MFPLPPLPSDTTTVADAGAEFGEWGEHRDFDALSDIELGALRDSLQWMNELVVYVRRRRTH